MDSTLVVVLSDSQMAPFAIALGVLTFTCGFLVAMYGGR